MEMVNPRSTLPVCNANAGVREDKFNEFLTMNNLALQTVTAGGIFSIGGMTSCDVHGGTIYAGIFAETCVSFSIMKYDGPVETINVDSESSIEGFRAIRFARVNFGSLGIVTSITLQCLPRPYQEALRGRMTSIYANRCTVFINEYKVHSKPPAS